MIIEPSNVILKNGQKLEIRSPQISDAKEFLVFLQTMLGESYRNMNNSPESLSHLTISDEEKILGDFAASKSNFMTTAFVGHRVVGNLGFKGDLMHFQRFNGRIGMGILKEFQGQGLGSELMRIMLEFAKKNSFHRVVLEVRTYNKPGIALYEKMGFRCIGMATQTAFVDDKFVDEFIYEKLL